MAKRLLLIFIIFLIVSGFAFSQQKEEPAAYNTISLSFSLIGAGVSYERMFNRNLSVLAEASYTTLIFLDEFTASGKGRWYPFGRAFYLELGLGYTYGIGFVQFTKDAVVGVFALIFFPLIPLLDLDYDFMNRSGGLLVQPGLGWKVDIGKPGGLVMPINLGLDFKIGSNPDFMPYLRLGLGYSF